MPVSQKGTLFIIPAEGQRSRLPPPVPSASMPGPDCMEHLRFYWKAVFLTASACLTAPRALHQTRFKAGPPWEASPHASWVDVANSSAKWWIQRTSGSSGFKTVQHATAVTDLAEGLLDLGVSPLGDSPWPCGKRLGVEEMRVCSEGLLGMYRQLSLAPEIVDTSDVTQLMDVGIYLATDGAHTLAPCRTECNNSEKRSRFHVVFDAQYSNEPNCCQLRDVPDGHAARIVKDVEDQDSSGNHITKMTTDGIRVSSYSGLIYNVLEPTSVTCSEDRPCPVVVEVPGASTVPWLILQAWCTGCMEDLGSIIFSVGAMEGPSLDFIENLFIPAVKAFLNSRNDADGNRVYLVSTSTGNEIAFVAALRHPSLFSFALLAGKFMIGKDIENAAAMAQPVQGNKLRKISFHVGSADSAHDEEQNFWSRLQEVVTAVTLPVELEMRYYPGGSHAMWYAGWNAYHQMLWRGRSWISDYLGAVIMTCTPS